LIAWSFSGVGWVLICHKILSVWWGCLERMLLSRNNWFHLMHLTQKQDAVTELTWASFTKCTSALFVSENQFRLWDHCEVQLDCTYLNSIISNSPLFWAQNNFPWNCSSVIHYWLFQTIFCFPRVRNSGVRLYILTRKSNKIGEPLERSLLL